MKTRQWILVALTLALAGLLGLGLTRTLAAPSGPEAQPGTVQGSVVATLVDEDYATITTTLYPDGTRTRYYNSFDLFVTANFSTSGVITITPQFSADNVNWVDGYYVAEAFSGTTYTSSDRPYRIVLSADGGSYIRNVPVVGWYMRSKIQASGAVTQGVEVLVQAVLRNN